MNLTISVRGQVLARFGNQLGALGEGRTPVVLSRALNHEGDKGRTAVKRSLAAQTGIAYGRLGSSLKVTRSYPSTLSYVIEATGNETNVGAFKAAQRKKGVSAAPWNERRLFAHTFLLKAVGGIKGAVGVSSDVGGGRLIAFVRTGKGRKAIRPVFGPNLAREIVKGETKAAFELGVAAILPRIAHEIQRELEG